jgi:hypothetical protein
MLLLLPLQAVFGTTDLGALAEAGTADELSQLVVPAVKDVLGELGTPVRVDLPGKVPLHERLYLVQLLARVSGQQGVRQPWMWLVWLVVRGVPSGLLPGKDALVDMAGVDSRPIHQEIRRMTLQLADCAILVVTKDFRSDQVWLLVAGQ